MDDLGVLPSFKGDSPAAAHSDVLPDRRELALVAVERTRMPMVITDAQKPDNPIVLANKSFLDLTGYTAEEVIGRNCRFLQGPETACEAVDDIRSRLAKGDPYIEVELLNYRKDGSTFWNQLVISPVHDDEGILLYYFASQRDLTSKRRAQALEATERLLLMEVDHRAMNAMALVQSIVSLSRSDTVEGFSDAIRGRVDALAHAHRLLGESRWRGAPFDEVLKLRSETNVSLSGPETMLPARVVQPLALIFHELISNARRHGALAVPGGRVSVTWSILDDVLLLNWSEETPHPVYEPQRLGVGLKLTRNLVERQLGGEIAIVWRENGFRADLTAPWEFRQLGLQPAASV